MRRPLSIAAACLLVLTAGLAACQSQQQPEQRGSLYFAAGNYLAEMDLRDGSTSVVANLGDAEIQEISPQLNERLLLTVFGKVNQRDVHRLVLYDIASRQTLELATGRHGRYLPGTAVLVYDDGTTLMMSERVSGRWETTEVLRHRYNAQLRLVPISATRFLYVEVGSPIHVYDKESGESTELAALSDRCDLDYALWLPDIERLICRTERADGSYLYPLVTLDGAIHGELSLPSSKAFRPLAWLPDQDALVLSERWRGLLNDRQRSAVWIYRIDDGTAFRLVDDQYLGNWVVYSRL
ncbi:MAG: hypothetical protein KJP17_02400 [Gammaproteobacteria bacterium]|nr:hypothetical protein [Gammaproteobacteria bacterium]